jgi:hypothetical protein
MISHDRLPWMLVWLFVLFASTAVAQQPYGAVGVLKGIVVNEDGVPVSGAEVDADDVAPSPGNKALRLALTDTVGEFTFNPIKFGTYKLFALKPEAGYPDTKFEIYAESYHKVTVTISPASPNALVRIEVGPKAGAIRLLVTDRATHKTIPNPTVILRRPDTGVWVSASQTGDSLFLLPPGIPTLLTINAEGYRSWSPYNTENPSSPALLKVDPGEEIEITAELQSVR